LIESPDVSALVEAVKQLHKNQISFRVMGQGSNLLVADAGVDFSVIRFCSDEPNLQIEGTEVWVAGNMLLNDLANQTIDAGVGDLSFCCGIPGTVAGAIVGNAGAFGRQIGDVVKSVRLLSREGGIREVAGAELGFAYRRSILKQSNEILLDARLKLEVCDRSEMKAEQDRIMQLRRSKHPDWHTMPCAGSIFKNIEPTSAADRRQAAGWFLEAAGARDFSVGKAHLFEKHANIIIADAGATAQDVLELMERMVAAVQEQFGFRLERELTFWGRV
jgi:UDP-N-acetylmuramate dehydrogenase